MKKGDALGSPLATEGGPRFGSAHLKRRVAELEDLNRQLEKDLDFHRNLFRENPRPSAVFETETLRLREVNDSALKLYGYQREQFLTMTVADLFAKHEQHRFDKILPLLLKGSQAAGPFTHQSADGRDLTVNIVSFPYVYENRDSRLLTINDETARRVAEDALRASEERFRELFENANDIVFVHDLHGQILAVNRAAERITGFSRSEILGSNFFQLISPESRELARDTVRAHLGGGAPETIQLPMVSKSGQRRHLEVSTRVQFRRGQAVAIQGIGRDITERQQAQERLEESSRQLRTKNEELSVALRLAKEATQLKEQFLANTSHELRTPMNGIIGMTNLLLETDLKPDQQEFAEAVKNCADDLLHIINDLLDLSQIESGRLALDEFPYDFSDSVENVINLLTYRAEGKQLKLTYEIDPALPALLRGDSVRIRQVVTNLIANAVKFTDTGGIHVKASIEHHIHGDRLRCAVIDSGIGVPDSSRDKIFQAFVQADGSTQRRFGGTGLGLTICKQLVELMGGTIGTYNNYPDPGATFWFEIPLVRA